jgi:hypothetical protein
MRYPFVPLLTLPARLAIPGLLALGLLSLAPARADDTSTFFNGKNLDGWQGLSQYWSVKEGAIVGATPEGLKFNTFLCSKKRYGDFELKFQIRLKGGKGNSGVQIRSVIFDKEHFAVKGPQCDIGGEYWGSLYGEHVGGMMKAASAPLVKKVLKNDGFNDYHIRCVGNRITIKLNGETTVDQNFSTFPGNNGKMPAKGIIAWQLHAGGPTEVTFRNIQFTDLSKK